MAEAKKVRPAKGAVETVTSDGVGDAPKTINLTSPWGTKVTVAADQADLYKDAGYKSGK